MSEWRFPNLTPPHKKKHEYKTGPSIFDETNPDSELNKSNMKGFWNMTVIFGFVFLFTKPLLNKLENGYFF
jgi:hypothetical protein